MRVVTALPIRNSTATVSNILKITERYDKHNDKLRFLGNIAHGIFEHVIMMQQ